MIRKYASHIRRYETHINRIPKPHPTLIPSHDYRPSLVKSSRDLKLLFYLILVLVLVHIYIEVRGFENQLKNIEKEKERNEIEKYVGLYARWNGMRL